MKNLSAKFREKLTELRINEIAKETGFEKRVPRKVEPIDLDMNTEQPFDLLRYLKKMDRLGFTVIDEKLLVGVVQKLPVRLIASKVSQSTYEARVRKTKIDRSVSTNRFSYYYQLLQWNMLITNIEDDV